MPPLFVTDYRFLYTVAISAWCFVFIAGNAVGGKWGFWYFTINTLIQLIGLLMENLNLNPDSGWAKWCEKNGVLFLYHYCGIVLVSLLLPFLLPR